jgi:hypothetical protein
MADKAFALSPISARPSLPSEEDYEAIREAFMETSRGRWFLGEYARRNRNADTAKVLDAVARIEEALAAQKDPPTPPADDRRGELLAAIRSALAQAEGATSAALDNLALDEGLAPIRKGARIIKEISWRWREIGADGRICDLIDSQVSAIEGGCGQIAGVDPRAALTAAFDLIKSCIDGLAGAEAAAVVTKASGGVVAMPVAPSRQEPAASAAGQVEREIAPTRSPAPPIEAAPEEPVVSPGASAEDADAYDEAVLELVAAEMAAPDPCAADDDFLANPDEPAQPGRVTEPLYVEAVAASAQEQAGDTQPALQSSPPVTPEPLEASLGATILANGILQRPTPRASDPLAPIRRMSQAEKIAFFS